MVVTEGEQERRQETGDALMPKDVQRWQSKMLTLHHIVQKINSKGV